ncbi:MAG: rhomboid family intramembrane serine protease [Bacteroidetes bacterium]|nr:rhomboid family intramembrane serine protease [Bacteroidota bacterium]
MFYQSFTGVVRHLIILNVLVFIGSYVILGQESFPRIMEGDEGGLGRLYLAAFMPGSQFFAPFQMATHMFMHGDIMHLAFNMLSLYIFGPMVEYQWGHRRFLLYYLICGVGAYLMHLGVQWWELERAGIDPHTWNVPMLGASGAIFGIYVAFAYLFPNQVISLLFPPISLKAKYFVLIMAGLELYYGVRGYSTGIAHFAHLGGAVFGFITIMIWYRGRLR